MRLFRNRSKKWWVAAVAVIALIVVASAWAAWTFMASGTGSDKTGSFTAPTIAKPTSPTADLLPGGTGAWQATVNNPNASALVLTALTVNGAPIVNGAAGCLSSNVTTASKTGLSIPVPAGTSQVSVPGVFTLAATAPIACMGVTIDQDVQATFSTP